jgi:phage host-nuclease inhibitor protein Gam
MKKDELHQSWSGMSEDILTGMLAWRLQHPKATFREIEAEVDQRLAVLRAKMIADAAMACA